ncbi:HNH endonuclease [Paraburkholderia caribensis]|uniref:HNH endonuclease n=1 Tax=Paraburkholderia caribensis TaxID=75105 RepID=UPI00209139F7|nr:HNH endonuclease [Paraburkholderia caribensis]MCO4880250.1 HNH endonuclease [Paraburkholderia caribensis]
MKHELTTEEIQSLRTRFQYNPETGELINAGRAGNLVKAKCIYLRDRRRFQVGRVILALMNGFDIRDKEIVRHKDGDPMNRRWSNLEVVPYSAIKHETPVRKSLAPHLDFLRECFEYEAHTGFLIWRKRPLHHFKSERGMKIMHKRLVGKRAGTPTKDGRRQIHITCGLMDLHVYTTNVIWALVHGEDIPRGLVVDHRDGNTDNERLENLRVATHAGNSQNSRSKKTAAGMRGICKVSTKYSVQFRINNATTKFSFSRSFDTLEDARMCRRALEFKYHGKYSFNKTDWSPELQTWLDKLDLINRSGLRLAA